MDARADSCALRSTSTGTFASTWWLPKYNTSWGPFHVLYRETTESFGRFTGSCNSFFSHAKRKKKWAGRFSFPTLCYCCSSDHEWTCGRVSAVQSLLNSVRWPHCGLCSSYSAHPDTGGATWTGAAWVGVVYIIYLHLKMETLRGVGSQLVHQSKLNNTKQRLVEPQAGVSLTGGVRADADFRPKGMVVLVGISCSVGY